MPFSCFASESFLVKLLLLLLLLLLSHLQQFTTNLHQVGNLCVSVVDVCLCVCVKNESENRNENDFNRRLDS